MPSNFNIFLKKTLGEDFLESLSKSELWKPGTKSVNDLDDMRIGLKIVPRTILSFLVRELSTMNVGDNKEVRIPVNGDAILKVTKLERDQYSGEIIHDSKIAVDFKFRSLPGVGLVIMSAFELYNVDDLDKPCPAPAEDVGLKVQKLIDERLALHDLIDRVVEKKLARKDAVHDMLMMKLTEELRHEKEKAKKIEEIRRIAEVTAPQSDPYFQGMTNGVEVANAIINEKEPKFVDAPKKSRPLSAFLEKRQKSKEFSVQLAKGEEISCPDCRKNIFDGNVFSGCICLGQDQNRKVFIKKSEGGVKVRFSRGWDQENIEMLLEVLQKKNR